MYIYIFKKKTSKCGNAGVRVFNAGSQWDRLNIYTIRGLSGNRPLWGAFLCTEYSCLLPRQCQCEQTASVGCGKHLPSTSSPPTPWRRMVPRFESIDVPTYTLVSACSPQPGRKEMKLNVASSVQPAEFYAHFCDRVI